ncbi:tRNA pseudouridine synthase D [Zalerion maritima]|uniref:tRNA pseudouridine synthase D n=1 Tax=Zalerion maritima TaxID=339359 RepID=A0AAD5WWY6_9PEZI|nr:tRNA pseudouridine synthase D [Zalerion maritima]
MSGLRRSGGHREAHVNNPNQVSHEQEMGIIHKVSNIDYSWTGKMRVRYTDFQVHEVVPNGETVYLTSFSEPQRHQATPDTVAPRAAAKSSQSAGPKESSIADEDKKTLIGVVGEDTAAQLIALDSAILTALANNQVHKDKVTFGPINDKSQRTTMHQTVRQAFSSRIETKTQENNNFEASYFVQSRTGGRAANNGKKSQASWTTLGGDYCHFTLYKENRDNGDAIYQLSRAVRAAPKDFGTAGTKDKRAATTQRVSVYRKRPEELKKINLNPRLKIKVGNFKFEQSGLKLGDLMGNEFTITLKECQLLRAKDYSPKHKLMVLRECVEASLKAVAMNGFLNYFGLQRFGTFHVGTHEIGIEILNSRFEEAVNLLLDHDKGLLVERQELEPLTAHAQDEINRAKACAMYLNSKSPAAAKMAANLMPQKFPSDRAILQHMSKSHKDYQGALLRIPRSTRSMYLHAYQSYIWNHVASVRWAKYGPRVIQGDLVLIPKKEATSSSDAQALDQDGEIILEPDSDDDEHQRARPLSRGEVVSGKYSIRDVVLPIPGWGIVYPENEMAHLYTQIMAHPKHGGLDPHSMRRNHKEFSLSGGYRKLIANFIGEPSCEVQLYADNNVQLTKTDLDLIEEEKRNRLKAMEETRERLASERNKKWHDFASNSVDHDRAVARKIADEKRRREEENPGVDLDAFRVNETWVQTGFTDNAKRVKLTGEKVIHEASAQVQEEAGPVPADLPVTENKPLSEAKEDEPMPDATATVDTPVTEGKEPSKAKDDKPMLDAMVTASGEATSTTVEDPRLMQHTSQQPGKPQQKQIGKASEQMKLDTTKTKEPPANKLAVTLKFKLHSSQYATMAIRELATAMFVPEEEASTTPSSDATVTSRQPQHHFNNDTESARNIDTSFGQQGSSTTGLENSSWPLQSPHRDWSTRLLPKANVASLPTAKNDTTATSISDTASTATPHSASATLADPSDWPDRPTATFSRNQNLGRPSDDVRNAATSNKPSLDPNANHFTSSAPNCHFVTNPHRGTFGGEENSSYTNAPGNIKKANFYIPPPEYWRGPMGLPGPSQFNGPPSPYTFLGVPGLDDYYTNNNDSSAQLPNLPPPHAMSQIPTGRMIPPPGFDGAQNNNYGGGYRGSQAPFAPGGYGRGGRGGRGGPQRPFYPSLPQRSHYPHGGPPGFGNNQQQMHQGQHGGNFYSRRNNQRYPPGPHGGNYYGGNYNSRNQGF